MEASKDTSEFYVKQLPKDGVLAWDFNAPDKNIHVLSGMAVALDMIRIYEAEKEEKFSNMGLKLLRDCIRLSYNNDAKFNDDGNVETGATETILNNSTSMHNPVSKIDIYDHGLVYADYYFLVIGNKLLELGLY